MPSCRHFGSGIYILLPRFCWFGIGCKSDLFLCLETWRFSVGTTRDSRTKFSSYCGWNQSVFREKCTLGRSSKHPTKVSDMHPIQTHADYETQWPTQVIKEENNELQVTMLWRKWQLFCNIVVQSKSDAQKHAVLNVIYQWRNRQF